MKHVAALFGLVLLIVILVLNWAPAKAPEQLEKVNHGVQWTR
jgi:hypothetical protein